MTDIAHYTLLATALIDLSAMLHIDSNALHINGYSNSQYYSSLRENDEFTSSKRLTPLAVLIACCTTMASMSWIVVMILAAVLIIQAIALLCHLPKRPVGTGKRRARIHVTALIITATAIAGVYYASPSNNGGTAQAMSFLAVMTLTTSPLLTMLANWLLRPINKQSGGHSSN